MSTHSSPFPSCFRPPSVEDAAAASTPLPPSPLQLHDNTNLTTCLYRTHLGIFSLTWSRTLFGRSLHLNLNGPGPSPAHSSFDYSPSSSTLSFHLHMKNIFFWKKRGSEKLKSNCGDVPYSSVLLFWDLSRAKFGSGPEPVSGFYIVVVIDGKLGLLVGDLVKLACARTRVRMSEKTASQALFLRREHVFGNRVYNTMARFGEKSREISVDCDMNGDGKLSFFVDKKRVLQVKRLKWKFRGNERVEFDRVSFQVSWDIYNWLFEDVSDRHAVFMFRFDKQGDAEGADERLQKDGDKDCVFTNGQNMLTWSQQQPWSSCSLGMNEIELRKIRKSMPRAARSVSASSMSSSASSSGSNSSVMEWASAEENDLAGAVGFSLLVYAWKRR